MGSKNLKAIAVDKGNSRPPIKDKEKLAAIAKQLYDNVMNSPQGAEYRNGSTLYMQYLMPGDGRAPVKNYTTSVPNVDSEKIEKFGVPTSTLTLNQNAAHAGPVVFLTAT
jgi:aldehyde:ferredoxin oxidoreductase